MLYPETCKRLRLVAFQFGMNDLVKIGWRSAPQKPRYVLALLHNDGRAIDNFAVHLSIGGKDAILRAGKDLQFHRGFWLQNQRAIRRQVRRDGSQHAALHLW